MVLTGKARDLKLTSAYVLELLGDEEFYLKCPAYFFMRDQGLSCSKRWLDSVFKPKSQPREEVVIAPAISSFLRVTYAMNQADPELLQPLRDFLQEKLAYPLGEVSMYYKHDEKIHSVRF